MKIVQIIPDFSLGGIEKAGCVLARELARLGHSAWVIGWGGGPRQENHPPIGLAHQVLADRRPSTLVRALVDIKPDVVHIHYAHYLEPMLHAIASEPALRETTVVSTPVFGRPPSTKAVLRITNTCVIGVYVYYRLLKWLRLEPEAAARQGIGFVRLNIWEPPPVSVSSLDPPETVATRRRGLNIPTGKIVLGRLARSGTSKWNVASEAWVNTLLEEIPEAAWVSIGFPEEYGATRLKKRWRERFVNFDETADYTRICNILSSLDVQVFFSGTGECFAFSIAEAAGVAVPTIALCTPTRDNGQAEQVVDGVSGALVATPQQAVAAIRPYVDDPAALRSLKQSALAFNAERSSAQAVMPRLLAFYDYCRGGRAFANQPVLEEMFREHRDFASTYHGRVSRLMSANAPGRARWWLQLQAQECMPVFRLGRFVKRILHPAPRADDWAIFQERDEPLSG